MKLKFWKSKEERSAATLANPPSWLTDFFTGGAAASGVTVTHDTAMNLAAVYACVKVLAESMASLPLIMYKDLPPRGKEKAVDHYLYSLLHDSPNPQMTSAEWRECMQLHLTLRGNAYSEKVTNALGQVVQLWPLHPDRMQIYRRGGELFYEYTVSSGAKVVLPEEKILHLRAFSYDGICGLSPIQQARESIGLAIAAETFGNKFFVNGARPSGAFKHPTELSEEAYKRLKADLTEQYAGLLNTGKPLLLEGGMDYQYISINPDDAQFLETRRFQVSEICRIFRVPPHLVADLDKATFSNIEQQSLDFVTYSLLPWCIKWEQRLKLSLLPEKERKDYTFKHNVAGLVRGDFKSRNEGYAVGKQNGWLSTNDIRELEEMNPVADGDEYLVPLNMIPASMVGKVTTENNPDGPGDTARSSCSCGQEHREQKPREEREAHKYMELRNRQKITNSFQSAFEDAGGRIVRREAEKVRAAAKKHLATRDRYAFEDWLRRFYDDEFPAFVDKQMTPVARSLAQAVAVQASREVDSDGAYNPAEDVKKYTKAFTARYTGSSKGQLRKVLRDAAEAADQDEYDSIEERLGEWEEKRPGKIAMNETNQLSNFIAKACWAASGVTLLRWATAGNSCPICDEMDGMVVGIESNFANEGDDVGGMTVTRDTSQPPLHGGCVCSIVPG